MFLRRHAFFKPPRFLRSLFHGKSAVAAERKAVNLRCAGGGDGCAFMLKLQGGMGITQSVIDIHRYGKIPFTCSEADIRFGFAVEITASAGQ